MRDLTAKQKKVLNAFIDRCYIPRADRFTGNTEPFKTPNGTLTFVLTIEDLPYDIYAELERLNDTEILYQETDRYLRDTSMEKN